MNVLSMCVGQAVFESATRLRLYRRALVTKSHVLQSGEEQLEVWCG